MRMTKIRVGLLLVLAAPLVQAQQSSQTLSWEDCVALAMRKNPDLAAASWNVEAARASYQGSFNGLLPQVSLSNGYSNGSGFSGDNHWQAQAKASMDVLNAGKIADIKSAAARLGPGRGQLPPGPPPPSLKPPPGLHRAAFLPDEHRGFPDDLGKAAEKRPTGGPALRLGTGIPRQYAQIQGSGLAGPDRFGGSPARLENLPEIPATTKAPITSR